MNPIYSILFLGILASAELAPTNDSSIPIAQNEDDGTQKANFICHLIIYS